MKSHSYIATTNPSKLAQKINRSGVIRLFDKEVLFVKENLLEVAGLCTEARAKELFEFVGQVFPKGFQCDPIPGEMDGLVNRYKAAFDARKNS